MKQYTVLYAEDIPHYGTLELTAADDSTAISLAKEQLPAGVATDADYDNSLCRRIVHIEDEQGRTVAADLALDGCFVRYGGEAERRLCDAAPDLLAALQKIAAIVLWGEPVTDPALRSELLECHEYDLEADAYNPCADSESNALTDAVDTARAALAAYRDRVITETSRAS